MKPLQVIIVMVNDSVVNVLQDGTAADRCPNIPDVVRRAIASSPASGAVAITGEHVRRRLYWHWETHEVVT